MFSNQTNRTQVHQTNPTAACSCMPVCSVNDDCASPICPPHAICQDESACVVHAKSPCRCAAQNDCDSATTQIVTADEKRATTEVNPATDPTISHAKSPCGCATTQPCQIHTSHTMFSAACIKSANRNYDDTLNAA